jgi:hypothetical protein
MSRRTRNRRRTELALMQPQHQLPQRRPATLGQIAHLLHGIAALQRSQTQRPERSLTISITHTRYTFRSRRSGEDR